MIALFFQCMNALLNPTNRTRGSTKWGLVAHTVALFSIETISVAIGLYELSASYIDGREFPGTRGLRTPGPFGYELLPKFTAISIVSTSVVQVNQWLFDGLLVSSALEIATQGSMFNLGCFSSCIAATSYTATTGLLPSLS